MASEKRRERLPRSGSAFSPLEEPISANPDSFSLSLILGLLLIVKDQPARIAKPSPVVWVSQTEHKASLL